MALRSRFVPLTGKKIFDAFPRVRGGKPGGSGGLLIVKPLTPPHANVFVQEALDASHHAGIVVGYHPGHIKSSLTSQRCEAYLMQQAKAFGFLGYDFTSGIEEFLGPG